MLLSLTLAFSGLTALLSMSLNLPHPGILITLGVYFALLFGIYKFKNSGISIALVFALTGFMGITLGPILSSYLALSNGSMIVGGSMFATAAIFTGLSAYVLVTKKDFSFMGGFLMVGIIGGVLLALAAIFLEMPGLSLAVSAMFIMLMSGLILFETSNIINGGETNYVWATVSLYVSIFNLFTSLLHLTGVIGGEE